MVKNSHRLNMVQMCSKCGPNMVLNGLKIRRALDGSIGLGLESFVSFNSIAAEKKLRISQIKILPVQCWVRVWVQCSLAIRVSSAQNCSDTLHDK